MPGCCRLAAAVSKVQPARLLYHKQTSDAAAIVSVLIILTPETGLSICGCSLVFLLPSCFFIITYLHFSRNPITYSCVCSCIYFSNYPCTGSRGGNSNDIPKVHYLGQINCSLSLELYCALVYQSYQVRRNSLSSACKEVVMMKEQQIKTLSKTADEI